MSTYTPTDGDLQFARKVLAGAPGGDDGLLIYYLVGMLRELLGMTAGAPDDVSAEQMVRNCRAAILAYDERSSR